MKYRVQIEIPAPAQGSAVRPEVVEAMKSVATALGAEVEVSETASADSYSLTVHTTPDPDEKE